MAVLLFAMIATGVFLLSLPRAKAIVDARILGAALCGAARGGVAAVGFVAVVALMTYMALTSGADRLDELDRWTAASMVLYPAVPATVVFGLLGCAFGAAHGATWRSALTRDCEPCSVAGRCVARDEEMASWSSGRSFKRAG